MNRKPFVPFLCAIFLLMSASPSVVSSSAQTLPAPVVQGMETDPAAGDTSAAEAPAVKTYATVDVLNIRALPSLNGRRLGRLSPGQAATVLEAGDEWLKIRTADGMTGFVFRAYTDLAVPQAPAAVPAEIEPPAQAAKETPAPSAPVRVAGTARALPSLPNASLERIYGQGLSTDMTQTELDRIVGQGFISALTPEEIAAIDAQGLMSQEDSRLMTMDLERIVARGVTFVVDKSKVDPADLAEIQGQGTVTDIGRAPFSVQVGVYKIRENAISMLEELKKKGYDPYIFQTVDDSNEKLYAIRIGDYQTLQDAYAVTTHFQSKENRPAIVTYINSLKTVSVEDLQPAAPAAPAPVVAPVPRASKTYADADLSDLYAEMERLREEVEKMRQESEAREMLRMTEAEAKQEEEDILSAADRQYIMSPKGTLNFDYTFGYTYDSYDVAEWTALVLEHSANHTLTNSLAAGYSFTDNFRLNGSVPFIYKYHEIGQADSKSVTDIGDVGLGASWQPFRTGGDIPALIFSANVSIPTGRSPYEINPIEDLSTGSGLFSASLGCSASKNLDPVVAFGGLAYSHAFEENVNQNYGAGTKTLVKVEPSGALGMSMGLGYALTYRASIHASFSYSYIFGTTYHYADGDTAETGTGAAASLSVGTGWKLSKRTVSVNLGIGLTNDASDFSFSFRIPFDYEL
ncbi:MAG: SH3 domain-containing protein [Thermodesulfobacteriota bacterium]